MRNNAHECLKITLRAIQQHAVKLCIELKSTENIHKKKKKKKTKYCYTNYRAKELKGKIKTKHFFWRQYTIHIQKKKSKVQVQEKVLSIYEQKSHTQN